MGWGRGDEAAFDNTVAADAIDHNPAPGQPEGAAGFKQAMLSIRSVFPDMTTTIDDIFSSGDRVAARWTSQGTHEGDLMGAAPT
ncbi:MAG: ester cyclase, partial [Actinomycetota bacterium]